MEDDEFADCNAEAVKTLSTLPAYDFIVPFLKELFPKGPFSSPHLYVITGKPQSYKTSFALEIIDPFLHFTNLSCKVVWLDSSLKFPLNRLRLREVNMDSILMKPCHSSEEILFNLQKIEFFIVNSKENGAPIRAVVIDSVTEYNWIDFSSQKLFQSTNRSKPLDFFDKTHEQIRYKIKEIVDRLVLNHGVSVIAIIQELMDNEYWKFNANDKSLNFVCEARKPGKGVVIYQQFCNKFSFDDKGRMLWGKRTLVPEK